MPYSIRFARFALAGAPALILCGGVKRVGERPAGDIAVLMPGGSDAPHIHRTLNWHSSFSDDPDIVLRIAEMQAQVELGRLLPKENLLPTIQIEDVSEDELAHWRVLGNFEALVTLDVTATDLSDAIRPFRSLLKADIVRQPR
jgi:hypothetical protein